MLFKQITWSSPTSGFNRLSVCIPETTKVKAVATAAAALLDAHARYSAMRREFEAVQGDPERLAAEAKVAAAQAGVSGKPVEPKKLRKKIRDAEENVAELELELEAIEAVLAAARATYAEVCHHHAPALAAEARAEADAGVLSLATASDIARRAEVSLTGALGALGGLAKVLDDGAEFAPFEPLARNTEFGQGGAVAPYIGIGVENLGTAVGYATQILDALTDADKARERQAKIDTEAAPDLDDDDE